MKKINFDVTVADYLCVQKNVTRRINDDIRLRRNYNWASKIKGLFVGIIVSIVFLVPLMLFIVNSPTGIILYVGYLVAILFLLEFLIFYFGTKIYRNMFKALIESHIFNKGLTSIIIGDHGIENFDESFHTLVKWQGVLSIEHWQDYILFHLPLYKGIFIPTRVFASQ